MKLGIEQLNENIYEVFMHSRNPVCIVEQMSKSRSEILHAKPIIKSTKDIILMNQIFLLRVFFEKKNESARNCTWTPMDVMSAMEL